MNIIKFKELHLNLHVDAPRTVEQNFLPSATDPTQDIPVKAIQLAANGSPLNVKELALVMSNVKIENMTSIERRHTDVFDKVAELQNEISKVAQKGVTTNFTKPTKKQKQNEE